MKSAPLLLVSVALPVLLALHAPAYGEGAVIVAAAEDSVAAAQKALDAAEAALRNAEETGGDIRAARRSLADAMKSLRAAERAAGIAPAQPTATAETAKPVRPAVPKPPAAAGPPEPATGPQPYQPPKAEAPKPAAPEAAAPKPSPDVTARPAAPTAKPPQAATQRRTPPRPRVSEPEVQVVRRPDGLTETRYPQPGGVVIVDLTDRSDRLVRRIRITRNGTQTVLVDRMPQRGWSDERYDGSRIYDPNEVPPPPGAYAGRSGLDGGRASEAEIEGALRARPGGMRAYSLNDIRRSEQLRERVAAVDLDTITFESGSARVPDDQVRKLERIGRALGRILDRWPDQVFLIEGHTDAVGTRLANQDLSDRRAASVAGILNRYFGIPAQSMVTQGYGEDYPKVPTDGPSRENRRVSLRNITPLLGR